MLVIGLCANDTYAQSSKTGNWFYYLGNNALNKKWNLHSELQYIEITILPEIENNCY